MTNTSTIGCQPTTLEATIRGFAKNWAEREMNWYINMANKYTEYTTSDEYNNIGAETSKGSWKSSEQMKAQNEALRQWWLHHGDPGWRLKEDILECTYDYGRARRQEKITKEMEKRINWFLTEIAKYTGNLISFSLFIEKGEINGTVEGDKRTIRIQTIGAGGYNIVRYHYRTLIHDVATGRKPK